MNDIIIVDGEPMRRTDVPDGNYISICSSGSAIS